jgi:hypothetical protein
LGLLFEHLSELEGDYEFEKIGICCEWTEYKNIEAAKKEYRVGVDGDLEDNTIVLKHGSGIVNRHLQTHNPFLRIQCFYILSTYNISLYHPI